MQAEVTFAKCLGGAPGVEGVLVGCRDGLVATIFLGNPFPVQLWQHRCAVATAAISLRRRSLAIVDDKSQLIVVDLENARVRHLARRAPHTHSSAPLHICTPQLAARTAGRTPAHLQTNRADSSLTSASHRAQTLYEEDGVHSAAFNSDHDDMLAYAGPAALSVRTATFAPHRLRAPGRVVAFQGATVFCLDGGALREESVPLSSTVQQCADAKRWGAAYEVACLGMTQQAWAALGHAALLDLDLATARKAFVRTQDLLMLHLVHRLELDLRGGAAVDALRGAVLAHQVRFLFSFHRKLRCLLGAHVSRAPLGVRRRPARVQGKYDDAAALFAKAGATERAVEMWTDLRQFDKATRAAQTAGQGADAVAALRVRQAQWSEEVRDYKAAAEMYLGSGQSERAVALLARHSSDWSHLMAVTRRLDKCALPLALQGVATSSSGILSFRSTSPRTHTRLRACTAPHGGGYASATFYLLRRRVRRVHRSKDRKALSAAAAVLVKHGERELACDVLLRLEDWRALVALHVEAAAWGAALMTAKRCPEEEAAVHAAHAEWLIAQDRRARASLPMRHMQMHGIVLINGARRGLSPHRTPHCRLAHHTTESMPCAAMRVPCAALVRFAKRCLPDRGRVGAVQVRRGAAGVHRGGAARARGGHAGGTAGVQRHAAPLRRRRVLLLPDGLGRPRSAARSLRAAKSCLRTPILGVCAPSGVRARIGADAEKLLLRFCRRSSTGPRRCRLRTSAPSPPLRVTTAPPRRTTRTTWCTAPCRSRSAPTRRAWCSWRRSSSQRASPARGRRTACRSRACSLCWRRRRSGSVRGKSRVAHTSNFSLYGCARLAPSQQTP